MKMYPVMQIDERDEALLVSLHVSWQDAYDLVNDVKDSYNYEYIGYRYEVWEPVEIDTESLIW